MRGLRAQGPFEPLRVDGVRFGPTLRLPAQYHVHDFSRGDTQEIDHEFTHGIGRYNERRPGMYQGEHFTRDCRDIHMGLDIGAPVGTEVHAFFPGRIFKLGNNTKPYDYGPTIITAHEWLGQTVYALHGHLSQTSLGLRSEGNRFEVGEVLGTLGDKSENGGWHPHLHFQLSLATPLEADLPGVVSQEDHAWALMAFPDPRLVLGPVY